MDTAPGGDLRRAGGRAVAPRRAAGLRADGVEAQRRRPGRSRPFCDRELADRAAAANAREPWPRAGALGAAARALVRHARLPRAKRQPSVGARNLSARMPKSVVRKALRGFQPYVPGEQPPDAEGWVKLNTNESPFPPSPKVIAAIKAAADESLRLYPSPTAAPAREAIARHFGLDSSQVTVGNGGDELIEVCF